MADQTTPRGIAGNMAKVGDGRVAKNGANRDIGPGELGRGGIPCHFGAHQ